MLESLQKYIGVQSDWEVACDKVESGAVRRFAQAIMDDDPAYGPAAETRWGSPVAPPLYPMMMFRRPLGAPDPVQLNAENPGFDGLGQGSSVTRGLPEMEPLAGYAILNGGTEVEFFRYARHAEIVRMRSRYVNVSEKTSSKGTIFLVVTESEFATLDGETLMRARRTLIRRKAR
ncbi:MAG: MaoC family dehydratase N-terminal domain-containing protein [Bradyrhizobium sp.]